MSDPSASHRIVNLIDRASGATARIAAGRGFNCFEFRPVIGGRPVDVLWSAEGFERGEGRPSGSGIPLLFPFPGRIRGTSFTWQGRSFQLEEGDNRGNAIHGFVVDRPWRVIEADERRAVGQFQASIDEPALLDRWPADFRVTTTYELAADRLTHIFEVENPDTRPLPFGYGAHPYFRLPMSGDDAGACLVRVPVSNQWALDNMAPTGERLAPDAALRLRRGEPFRDAAYDDIFGGLTSKASAAADGLSYESFLDDPSGGVRLRVAFDEGFTACVVYVPPHREAICIEPYTCLPDAFALESRGVQTGLRVLAPGESFRAQVVMQLLPRP